MAKKVTLAIFDRDLKVRTLGKFKVSKDGSKISVKRGGKAHFNPSFDNDSYLEFPRSRLLGGGHKKIYIVRRGSSSCVSFKDDPATVYGPDPEEVMNAAKAEILDGLGKDKQDTPIIVYIILALAFITTMKVLGVIP